MMDQNQDQGQEYAKQYGQIVAKAWADDDFKARLLADPATVLREEGLAVPAGMDVRAVENTDKVLYLALPPKPSEDLSDEQLSQVAGGASSSTAGCAGSIMSICGTASCVSSAGSASTIG